MCPIVGTARTISYPGVSVGTMIDENFACPSASGSVIAKTVVKAAREAPLVNHLWPLITHSSPSSTAVVCISVGSEPATSGSVRPTDG